MFVIVELSRELPAVPVTRPVTGPLKRVFTVTLLTLIVSNVLVPDKCSTLPANFVEAVIVVPSIESGLTAPIGTPSILPPVISVPLIVPLVISTLLAANELCAVSVPNVAVALRPSITCVAPLNVISLKTDSPIDVISPSIDPSVASIVPPAAMLISSTSIVVTVNSLRVD